MVKCFFLRGKQLRLDSAKKPVSSKICKNCLENIYSFSPHMKETCYLSRRSAPMIQTQPSNTVEAMRVGWRERKDTPSTKAVINLTVQALRLVWDMPHFCMQKKSFMQLANCCSRPTLVLEKECLHLCTNEAASNDVKRWLNSTNEEQVPRTRNEGLSWGARVVKRFRATQKFCSADLHCSSSGQQDCQQ